MATNKKILEKMRQNFKFCEEFYSDHRNKALEDFKFRAGDQWDDKIRQDREQNGRPCLTINKLTQFIGQICNQFKRNRPGLDVKAMDSNADYDTALILSGIIKNIEKNSLAEDSYDIAFENGVTCGEGYIRIVTEYEDPLSFDQTICIKPIHNIFSVYVDPLTKEPDYSDMDYAFILSEMSKEEFKRSYPDSDGCSQEFQYLGLSKADGWINKDTIRMVEYFYLEHKKENVYQLEDGTILRQKEYESILLTQGEAPRILKTKQAIFKEVKWIKTNGYEILEETTFPGSIIPVIPFYANKYICDGKVIIEGIVRHAKEAQRAYNFWTTAQAEMIALAPKAPYIGAAGQFENFEGKWNSSNTKNHAYLEYNPKDLNGQALPAPQRTQFDPAINTIIQAMASSNEDLKSSTGIYDPSLGKEQREVSGIAIANKQQQSELTNFQYADNMMKTLKIIGKILVDIIPKVYDTKRMIRILGDNNNEDKIVTINEAFGVDKSKSVFLGIGKYDVDISIDSFGDSQKQQANDAILELMKINPNSAPLMSDIFVGNMDWKGAKEISARLKTLLPANLQDPNQLSPEMQAQLQASQQEFEQKLQGVVLQNQELQKLTSNLTAELNQTTSELKNKTAEIQSKERIAEMNARVELIKVGIKEDSIDSRLLLERGLNSTEVPKTEVPNGDDYYVLPGVNDPETNKYMKTQNDLSGESKIQGDINGDGVLSEDEANELLNKINEFNVPKPKFGTRLGQ